MAKFRKKQVVIEAERFDGTAEDAQRLSLLYAKDVWPEFGHTQETHAQWTGRLCIKTLDSIAFASAGDWILTGVQGERYPCTNDIFVATYEPVEAALAAMERNHT